MPYKPEVFVNVLGLSSGSGPRPVEAAQRCSSISEIGSFCKNITLGCSREPPASWFCCVSGSVGSAPAAGFCNAQKRLPSGLWACDAWALLAR